MSATHLGSFVGDSDRFPAGRRGGLPFIQHQSDWLSGPTTAQSGGELPECLRHLPLTRSPTPRNSVPHEMLGWDASQGRRGEIHRGKPTAGRPPNSTDLDTHMTDHLGGTLTTLSA
ncbi:hypothetical protein CGCF413_v011977 [Colletotrichum fructicola]|nr:hypothetical protein CGCF413_v011977 [Colletotrichum fructicola]